MAEENEIDGEDVCSNIANLSSALSSLDELSTETLSDGRKKKLARAKRQIFDAMVYYAECLPELIDDTNTDEKQDKGV